jgi:hypothetical protein
MVRLEDLVYAPRETLQQLCDCVVGDGSNNNSTFHYQPQFLQQRRGGRVVVKDKDDDKTNNHALVEAWTRHARATIEHIVPPEQQVRESSFRDLWAQEQARMQPLLEALHYAIV